MELHLAWDCWPSWQSRLGCLFFLFELFVGMTSSSGNGFVGAELFLRARALKSRAALL